MQTISVSWRCVDKIIGGNEMKKCIFALLFILISVSVVFSLPTKQKKVLYWDAPTTNVDGSPLTDLAGYKIYWSTTSGGYTDANSKDVGNVLTISTQNVTGSSTTVYYFVATAYDTAGNESDFSNEVSNTIPLVPAAPGAFRLQMQ